MTLLILSRLCIIISSSIIISFNPLTSGLLILLLALSIAGMYASIISSWYAFLVFLIYIGGILVIFSYFVALIPNQEKISIKLKTAIPILFIRITIYYMAPLPVLPYQHHSIFSLYTTSNSSILLLLALLLLLTIVIIVKITNLSKGPLRPFNIFIK